MPDEIILPLLNPNEPEAILAALYVSEGQWVDKGEPLCSLETTKSTADVEAETGGFVAGLRFAQGDSVRAGDLLCYLSPDAAWRPPTPQTSLETSHGMDGSAGQPAKSGSSIANGTPVPEGLRITQPALALVRQSGLDLGKLPKDQFVTEEIVRALLEEPKLQAVPATPHSVFDPIAIIVYGGGGHGKALIDLLRVLGVYRILGVVDDGLPCGGTIMGLPVLGGAEALPDLHTRGVRLAVNAVGGIGNLAVRSKVFETLSEAGFACPALVHPTAFVEASAVLSAGAQVMPHAYVGSQARLGFGCIVNTGAIVSHDCVLGDLANISPGAILAGEVQVGAGTLVGMGVTINLRVRIGSEARIGNGATVKTDVPDKGIVRAGDVWPK
jgi:acetyltransferase EpsM